MEHQKQYISYALKCENAEVSLGGHLEGINLHLEQKGGEKIYNKHI